MMRPSKATRAVGYATQQAIELYRDPDGEAYADVPGSNGARRTIRIRTREFRSWLGGIFFAEEANALGGQSATDAVDVIAAMAVHAGREREIFVRIAEGPNGEIYLDLGDNSWQAIRVTPDGWDAVTEPPVRFRRPRGLRPLPVPVRGAGDGWGALQAVLHVAGDRDWTLLVAWLIGALHPFGPYPILGLTGEQGTAKTTTGRILRSIIDPSAAPLRSPPREDRDLVIAAKNSHVVAFDNLSRIPYWLSDALCRIATGGGYAARQLYTDGEEVIYSDRRPIILTSIEDVATRGDLADRTITVTLPLLPEKLRRTEADLDGAMQQIRPAVLGDLFDALALGLRRRDAVELPRLPRMADFAAWVVACEPALPFTDGAFLHAYEAVREDMVETGIEADPVATALLYLVREEGSWTGTATELLADLDRRRDGATPPRGWPETPQAMGGRLTRAAPLLRASGIGVLRGRGSGSKRTRIIELAQVEEKPSDVSGSSESSGCAKDRPAENPHATSDSDMSDMWDGVSHTRAMRGGPIGEECPSCGDKKPLAWEVCGDCQLKRHEAQQQGSV